MKRFKAFTLTEILTGTILQAGFVIVLMGAFYMLVNFQTENTKLITAREKGQRVLAYIENRIMHAGLGLWKCGSSTLIRGSFGADLRTRAFNNIILPVAVTKGDTGLANGWASTTRDIYNRIHRGNILTVLYSVPYAGTDRVLVIDNENSGSIKTISGDITCKFLDGTSPDDLTEYAENEENNLRSYKVSASSGAPLYISDFNGSKFDLTTKFTGDSVDVASGSEIMNLQCEKIYAVFDVAAPNENSMLERVRLKDYSRWQKSDGINGAKDDSEPKSYENGILDIYFELDTRTNTLDCYVLVSGGYDPLLNNPFPKLWPDNSATSTLKSNWTKRGYNHHEIYISRASWKLHNIPDGFTWSWN